MTKTVLLPFLLVALLSPIQAHSQTQQEIRLWIPDFKKQTDEADSIGDNLRAMSASPGISTDQYQELNMALKYLQNFQAAGSGLLPIAYIYASMIDPRDTATVKAYLGMSCGNLKATGNVSRSSINELLPMVVNSAIRAEITKARDAVASVSSTLFCK